MKTKITALSKNEMSPTLKQRYEKACRLLRKEYGTLKGFDAKLASLKSEEEQKAYLEKLIKTLEQVANAELDPMMN